MYAVERLSSYISRGVYTVSAPFHPFGGAVDIIVVQQQDGSFKSSPWYVRFGKFQGVLKTTEKVVTINVNETGAGFPMYLDHTGEAFFLREVEGDEGDGAFSPPLFGDEADEQVETGRLTKSQSLSLHSNQSKSPPQNDMGNGKIMARANTRRPRIFGLMFGQRSMKEGSRHSEGDADVQRISSLERAKIAADLLDVKWSTNLPANNQRMDDASETPAIVADKDVQVSVVDGLGNQNHGVAQRTLHETTGPHDDVGDENSGAGEVDAGCSDEIRGPNHPCVLIAHERVLLESTSSSDLADRSKVMSEHSMRETTAGSDGMRWWCNSETMALDLQEPDFVKLEQRSSPNSTVLAHTNVESASHNEDGHLTTHGLKGENEEDCVSKDESKGRGVSSYVYSEASVSSSTGVKSSERELEIPNCHVQGLKEIEIHTEILCETAELIPEMNLLLESNAPTSKGTLHEGIDSCESHHPGYDHENEGTLENSTTKDIDLESTTDGRQMMTESLYSHNMILSTVDSIEAEIVEAIHSDNVVGGLTAEGISVVKQVEVFEYEPQLTSISSSHLSCNNKVSDEKTSTAPDSCVQMAEIDQRVGVNEDEECRTMCTFSHLSNSINHVLGGDGQGEGANMHQLEVSSEVIIGPQECNVSSPRAKAVNSRAESLEKDQLLFGNIDNLAASRDLGEKPISEDAEEADNHLIEDIDDECASSDTNRESPWSSNRSFGFRSFSTAASYSSELVQDPSSSALESFPEESRIQTSPINIPKSCLCAGGLVEMGGSAPNIRGHIYDLDVRQPLSRSLDSSSRKLKWDMHRKELLTALKSQVTSESNSEQDQSVRDAATAVDDARSAQQLARLSTNPAVGKKSG